MAGLVDERRRAPQVLARDLQHGRRAHRAAVPQPQAGAQDRRSQPLVHVGQDRRDHAAERLEHRAHAEDRQHVARAQQPRQAGRRARVHRVAVELQRGLDLQVAPAEVDHVQAHLLELLQAEGRAQLGGQHVALALEAIDGLAQVPADRNVEVALERPPRHRRGEVLEVLQAGRRGAPMRHLAGDLEPQRCRVVSQTGTPRPT
jgi:hypothetical protein